MIAQTAALTGAQPATTTGLHNGKVPIEWLDFPFVRACNDGWQLEQILTTLRSGQEGIYLELEAAAEQRLRQVFPKSQMLVTTEAAVPLKYLGDAEQKGLLADLALLGRLPPQSSSESPAPDELPPVRAARTVSTSHRAPGSGAGATAGTPATKVTLPAVSKATIAKPKAQRIAGHDFRAWDRFDADAELEYMDSVPVPPLGGQPPALGAPTATAVVLPSALLPSLPASKVAQRALAEREKVKGNESFQAGDLEEAAVYYSRSLHAAPLVATFNNRALVRFKLGRHVEAVADCDAVLAMEPGNLKALIRRASALRALGDTASALADVREVLVAAPDNKDARTLLATLTPATTTTTDPAKAKQPMSSGSGPGVAPRTGSYIEEIVEETHTPTIPVPPATTTAPAMKMTRLLIEEDEDEDEAGSAAAAAAAAAARSEDGDDDDMPTLALAAPMLEEFVDELKEISMAAEGTMSVGEMPAMLLAAKAAGQQAFEAGQFTEAVDQYTTALALLSTQPSPSDEVLDLRALLLTDRATSHFKSGACHAAVIDCNEALALRPCDAKTLLRRAAAYEALEQYALASADYVVLLNVDPNSKSAQEGLARTRRLARAIPATNAVADNGAASMTYDALKNQGNALVTAQAYSRAVDVYAQCIALDASQVGAWNNRALCHLKLGNFGAAVADARTVLTLDPTIVKARFRLAQALVGLGDRDEAAVQLRACLQIDAGNAQVKAQLAAVLAYPPCPPAPSSTANTQPALAAMSASTPPSPSLSLSASAMSAPPVAAPALAPTASLSTTAPTASASSLTAQRVVLEAERADAAGRAAVLEAQVLAAKAEVAKATDAVATVTARAAQASVAVSDAGCTLAAVETEFTVTAPPGCVVPPLKAPATPHEFMVGLARFLGNAAALAAFVHRVPPVAVKRMFGKSLEAKHVLAVVPAVAAHMRPIAACDWLRALATVERFGLTLMFLDAAEKLALARVLSQHLRHEPAAAGLDKIFFPWI